MRSLIRPTLYKCLFGVEAWGFGVATMNQIPRSPYHLSGSYGVPNLRNLSAEIRIARSPINNTYKLILSVYIIPYITPFKEFIAAHLAIWLNAARHQGLMLGRHLKIRGAQVGDSGYSGAKM